MDSQLVVLVEAFHQVRDMRLGSLSREERRVAWEVLRALGSVLEGRMDDLRLVAEDADEDVPVWRGIDWGVVEWARRGGIEV